MKKRISLCLLVFAVLTAYAQTDTTYKPPVNDGTFGNTVFPANPISRWSVGLFGGVDKNHHVIDVLYASDMKYTDMGGKTAGVSASWHAKGWLSLRADVAFVQKNYRMDRDNRYLPFVYTESVNNYLSVPVTAVVSMGRTFRVCGFFGGYAGYWLSGHRSGQSLSVTYLTTHSEEDTYFDADYTFDEVRDNRFDAGLVFGAAMRCALFKKLDISAEMRWYYGLTDIQKNYMVNLNPRYNTTRTMQVGLSYWF
jgi:hypothetical protein